jgi:hypothetical protein
LNVFRYSGTVCAIVFAAPVFLKPNATSVTLPMTKRIRPLAIIRPPMTARPCVLDKKQVLILGPPKPRVEPVLAFKPIRQVDGSEVLLAVSALVGTLELVKLVSGVVLLDR